jgi:NAD(P)-dependent dehydrogenase (short-subunit alcohol dehydrogenase family)
VNVTELFSLRDKVAVVTGGSRGIGRAIAELFSAAGATVVVASRKLDACERAAEEIFEATGGRVIPLAFHAGRWSDCDRLVDETIAAAERIDVLVNNAGMSPLYDSLDMVTEELYDKTLGVNLKGPFRLSARVGALMAEGDGGVIINVGTIGSQISSPNELPYACAKAGLNAMTVGMAAAFAPKVRVNAILPGPVRTDVTRGWDDNRISADIVPLERLGEPEDLAGMALCLASSASNFTTGAIIRVDGGTARRV